MASVKILIRVLIFLQCTGLAAISILDGTSLGTYLYLYGNLAESLSYALNYGIAGTLSLVAIFSIYKVRPLALFTMALIFGLESLFKTILGGSFASDLTLAAHMVRFSWPLLFGLVILFDGSWHSLRRRDVLFFFRLFIAVTFFVHGVEALMMHPKFIDFIIVTNKKLEFLPATEAFARQALIGIGIVDLLVAVILVFKPVRWVLAYMVFWGALTASIRYVYADTQGIPDVMIRAPHYCVPMLIWILSKYRMQTRPEVGRTQKTLVADA